MIYYIINMILLCVCVISILYSIYRKNNNNKIDKFIDKNYKIILIIIFVLMIVNLFYKYGIVPLGIHVDEAGMFYDAKLLAKYGIDRYLNKYPLYLINYGGGQSAMYAYLACILIKIFGYHMSLMRMPAAIIRIVSFISCYLLIKCEKDKLKRIIFLCLLAITPYFIMQSRWGLDCNLLVGFMGIAVSLLINAINKDNNKLLLLSGIMF